MTILIGFVKIDGNYISGDSGHLLGLAYSLAINTS